MLTCRETTSANRNILYNLRKQFLQAEREKIEQANNPPSIPEEPKEEIVPEPPKKKKKKAAEALAQPIKQIPAEKEEANATELPKMSSLKLKKKLKGKVAPKEATAHPVQVESEEPVKMEEEKPKKEEKSKKEDKPKKEKKKAKQEDKGKQKEAIEQPKEEKKQQEVPIPEVKPEFKLGETKEGAMEKPTSAKKGAKSPANGSAKKQEAKGKSKAEQPPVFSLSPSSQPETPTKSLAEFGFGKTPEEPAFPKGKSKNVKFGQNKVKGIHFPALSNAA